MKNVKLFALGAVAIGLGFGGILGYQSLATTGVASADTQNDTIVQEVRGERAVVTDADVSEGIASIKSFAKNDRVNAKFLQSAWNAYYDDPAGKPQGQVNIFADSDGWMYLVALDTNKVIQVGPMPRESLDAPTPSFDLSEKYSKEDLQGYAEKWLKDHGISVEEGLSLNVTSKDEHAYFFRWTDEKAVGEMRFLQVGFTTGGSLLSYTNTL